MKQSTDDHYTLKIKRTPWTKVEQDALLGLRVAGKSWDDISGIMYNRFFIYRSPNAIKMEWLKLRKTEKCN